MKQKDAIKLSTAIACIAAAAIIAYLTMREPKAPAPTAPTPTADATGTAPTPSAAPKDEHLTIQGGKDQGTMSRGPIRIAPTGK